MNLLGHFDFGLNHKNVNIYNKNQNDYHTNDSNYWLKLWIDVYKYLIEFYNFRNVKFICYEQFCDRKKNYLTKFLCNEYNEDKIFSKIDSDKLINKNDENSRKK